MAENKVQDYFDDDNEGHIDTRERNFECENPDKHLGCNMGIDVQGQNFKRQTESTIIYKTNAYASEINCNGRASLAQAIK